MQTPLVRTSRGRRARRLDTPTRYLPPVEASQVRRRDGILVLATLHLGVRRGEDDLNMTRVTLVRIDTTVRTVCAATSFLYARASSSRDSSS